MRRKQLNGSSTASAPMRRAGAFGRRRQRGTRRHRPNLPLSAANPARWPLLRAYLKLAEAAGATGLPTSVHHTAYNPTMQTIWSAFTARRPVKMTYVNAHGERRERIFETYGTLLRGMHSYLVGRDRPSGKSVPSAATASSAQSACPSAKEPTKSPPILPCTRINSCHLISRITHLSRQHLPSLRRSTSMSLSSSRKAGASWIGLRT